MNPRKELDNGITVENLRYNSFVVPEVHQSPNHLVYVYDPVQISVINMELGYLCKFIIHKGTGEVVRAFLTRVLILDFLYFTGYSTQGL